MKKTRNHCVLTPCPAIFLYLVRRFAARWRMLPKNAFSSSYIVEGGERESYFWRAFIERSCCDVFILIKYLGSTLPPLYSFHGKKSSTRLFVQILAGPVQGLQSTKCSVSSSTHKSPRICSIFCLKNRGTNTQAALYLIKVLSSCTMSIEYYDNAGDQQKCHTNR